MAQGDPAPKPDFMLVIHGGAGKMSQHNLTIDEERGYIATLDSGLRRGYEILNHGGTSLDAVQAAAECHFIVDQRRLDRSKGNEPLIHPEALRSAGRPGRYCVQ